MLPTDKTPELPRNSDLVLEAGKVKLDRPQSKLLQDTDRDNVQCGCMPVAFLPIGRHDGDGMQPHPVVTQTSLTHPFFYSFPQCGEEESSRISRNVSLTTGSRK
jgi:hypothetical protein